MARFRSKPGFPVTPETFINVRFGGYTGAHWQGSDSRASLYTEKKTMTDTVTPGYKKLKATGGVLPVNTMVKTEEYVESSPGEAIGQYRHDTTGQVIPCVCTGDFAVWELQRFLANAPPPPALNKNVAVQSALARANAAGWDALTSASELHKTIRLLTGARQRLINLINTMIKAIRRRKLTVRSVGDLHSAFANLWLEYRYGWRILYYDMLNIQEAMKMARRTLEVRRGGSRLTASSSSSWSYESGNMWNSGSVGGTSNIIQYSGTVTQTRIVRAGAGVEVAQYYGTNISVPRTAWELIPFSFVVDWFITVGDLIETLDPTLERRTSFCWSSDELVRTFSLSAIMKGRSRSGAWSGWEMGEDGKNTPSHVTYTVVTKTRQAESFPGASLRIRTNLNAPKFADLWALAWQLWRRA